jgi:hypothetical protein
VDDSWSQVPALVDGLNQPTELKRLLKERVQQAYMDLSRLRGPVHVPEDTWDMHRRLGGAHDLFKGYQAAFAEVVKLLKQIMEEELVEAVGEQDGIPNQGMTIPDPEGDIRLSRDEPTTYEIDLDQLLAVLAEKVSDQVLREELTAAQQPSLTWAAEFAVGQAVATLLSWGKFEPQVSKVRAYAATLARNGDDQAASIVSGAITQSNPYRGVKFERKQP